MAVPLTWTGDYLAMPGLGQLAIFSEHVRGERRWYWALFLAEGRSPSRGWEGLPFEGSNDKRVVRRRAERWATGQVSD